jgi:4'-phosphopantetheinyl transferase
MAGELAQPQGAGRLERTSSPLLYHLGGDDVHIWQAGLDQPDESLADYYSLLSEDEISRSARFVFDKDRRHYIVGRAILRLLVAGYLDTQPAKIEFSYSPLGKPFITREPRAPGLLFNLAHSHNRAVYAFSLSRRVGIDLEQIREMPEMDRFADFNYSSRECAFLNSLNEPEKTVTFYKIWTCKEAIFKAVGAGLTKEISQTEISLTAPTKPELVCIDGDIHQAAGWQLELFTPFEGYQAALAVENQVFNLDFRQAINLWNNC